MIRFEDKLLEFLTECGLLHTRFNKETKEQEFCITHFGTDVYKLLEFLVKKKGGTND